MYYLDGYFKERNWPRIGRTLGGIYALALVIGCFGVGNMFQSNQAYQQMLVITGGETSFLADYSMLFGLVLAGIVGLVRRQTLDGGVRVDRDASFCDVPPDSLEVGIAFARAPIDEIRLPVGVDISRIETRIVIPV